MIGACAVIIRGAANVRFRVRVEVRLPLSAALRTVELIGF
jgi:hypothetical protein